MELRIGINNRRKQFAGIRECLSVFGNDYDTPDGTCLRDYIDVVDLPRLMWLPSTA